MAGESDDLDKLFESVADGESVDWDALERDAPDDDTRALIRQLRLIAEVAEVHRSQVDEPTPADVALTLPALRGVLPIQPSVARRVLPGIGSTPGAMLPGNVSPGSVRPGGSGSEPDFGTWGHLLLVRKIGEGSYGEVFHAHDTWLDHPVALKLLKPEAEGRVQPSDLLHEARRLARVRHDNVVRVHGADRHNGRVGFWMDFIDGETLAARVAKGRLSAGEATSVGQEVCRALAAVHRANIIHRDVKAQNVMRAHDGGGIILMDFGAGELQGDADVGRAQGTPLYMAPELFEDAAASVRTDIYAAGVLLFYLVTDAFPVNGGSMRELRDAHARGDRRRLRDERPDLPDSFITIVERAIDPDPMRRYATAGDMEAKLAGEPSIGRVPVVPGPSRPPSPDYTKRVASLAGGVLVLTGALGFVAARFFEVVVQVDREFSAGVTDIFVVGARAMLALVIIGLFFGSVLGLLAAFHAFFGDVLSTPLRWLRAFIESCEPLRLAVGIAVAGALLSATLNVVVFGELFEAMFALAADPATTADLSVLGQRSLLRYQGVTVGSLGMLLGLAGWYWFVPLQQRAKDPSTIQILRWATLAIAFITLALFAAPRRVLWERFPVVTFDNRTGFVIGTVGDESLVYILSEPARPRVKRRADTLERTGDIGFLFDLDLQR